MRFNTLPQVQVKLNRPWTTLAYMDRFPSISMRKTPVPVLLLGSCINETSCSHETHHKAGGLGTLTPRSPPIHHSAHPTLDHQPLAPDAKSSSISTGCRGILSLQILSSSSMRSSTYQLGTMHTTYPKLEHDCSVLSDRPIRVENRMIPFPKRPF